MDTFGEDLKQPLLSKEDDSDNEFYSNSALDDSSSGYESTELEASDPDVNIQRKSASNQTPRTSLPPQQVRAHVNCAGTLCESLKLILDMPEMCDVMFLVGPEAVPVYGLRSILGVRSRVMYQLILNALHKPELRKSSVGKHLTIPVKKYDPVVFRMIIQFIHCGYATIDDVTVTGLMCAADQFELREMKQACWKYIDTRLECGSVESILRASWSYRQHRMYEVIVDEINSCLSKR